MKLIMESWKRFLKESSDTSSEEQSRREQYFADMRARATARGVPTPSEFGLSPEAQQEVRDQAQKILDDHEGDLGKVRDFLGAYTIKITARDPGKSYPRLGYLKQLLRQHFEEQGVKPLF